MRKTLLIVFATLLLSILAACSEDELSILEVDFEVPETVNVGETVELKATVTYGDEMVADADEVVFEVWEKG
ncbi:MAG TPA: FixH family protein, partial [Virgibacillus sp.]|nr:FixH family protein [Virgibacillus sp.]